MRFAVDAHAIGRHLTGNEVYVRSLLNGFAALDRESEFIAYLSMDDVEAWVPSRFPVRHIAANPFIRLGCDLSYKLRRDRPQLVHVQYTAPIACPVPIVVSVHDVSFLEHPDYFPFHRALQLRLTVRRTIRQAARILTGSEFSRDSIARAYDLDPDRIAVVHNAATAFFHPVRREVALAEVREQLGITAPFILSVGDLQPRKNHVGLIEAFAALIQANPQLKHELVLAGKETWFVRRVREAAKRSGIADRIRFLGFVSDDALLHLYNACELFCFPSFYEGFGLPVLEAMACGAAVACSNTSAIPEVADGAALLFNPYNADEITRAMLDLILLPELCARMRRLGQQRSMHFSWQQTAQKTLEVYRGVVEQGQPARRRVVRLDGSPMILAIRARRSKWVQACGWALVLVAMVWATPAPTPSPAADPKPALTPAPGPTPKPAPTLTGFPFTDETLHYTVNWPSGLGLGEARMTATRGKGTSGSGDQWGFELVIDAAVPGFAVADHYRSSASTDLCSATLEKDVAHGSRKSRERTTFDQHSGTAKRETAAGGKSDIDISACARDALAFLYFARRELGQGRVPPRETILFGAQYQVRLEYTGAQQVRANDSKSEADRVIATVKGPASELSFEMFFARDAARTPLVIRVPLSLGMFSMELAR